MPRKPTRRFRNRHKNLPGQSQGIIPSRILSASNVGGSVTFQLTQQLFGDGTLNVINVYGDGTSIGTEVAAATRSGNDWQVTFSNATGQVALSISSTNLFNVTGGQAEATVFLYTFT